MLASMFQVIPVSGLAWKCVVIFPPSMSVKNRKRERKHGGKTIG